MTIFEAHGHAKFQLYTPLIYGVDLEGPFNKEFFIKLCEKIERLLQNSSDGKFSLNLHLRFKNSALLCKDGEQFFLDWVESILKETIIAINVSVSIPAEVEGKSYITDLARKISSFSLLDVFVTYNSETALTWHRQNSVSHQNRFLNFQHDSYEVTL